MVPLRVGAYEVAGKKECGCSFLLVVVMQQSTLPFPFAKAMDVNNQVSFLLFLATLTNGNCENADLKNSLPTQGDTLRLWRDGRE